MKKIMYVEDDADTRNLVARILEAEGYTVITAESGDECLSLLGKESVDLILLDIILPTMSGWDAFEKIKNVYSVYEDHGWPTYEKIRDVSMTVKVAFLSVIPVSDERLSTLKSYGVSDYLMKPFEKADLLVRIRKILEEA
jgi:two-component system OmpR family response regulator